MSEMLEKALKANLENSGSAYAGTLYEAMYYSVSAGGKRIRPLLTELFCRACGGSEELSLPFAEAVEYIHTYSLIHDDLPAMDNDDMRRGQPSNHIKYGEDMAILAGDGLLTRAFEVMLSPKALGVLSAERCVRAAYYLAKCAGADGMVGGQCIDISSEGREITEDELNDLIYGKTVCLIKAACGMGVIAAGGTDEELASAEAYAEGIGFAFQIRDDILDVIGSSEKLGKNTGMDKANEHLNYVTLYGTEGAQKLVDSHTAAAITALENFHGDTAELKALALKLASRDS